MKTLYMIALETANLKGYEHTILPNTTLNEYHEVGTTTITQNPTLNYFILGLRLTPTLDDVLDEEGLPIDEGVFNLNRNLHTAKHGNVFKPIPFRLVRSELALSTSERKKYRLVKTMTIGGINYIAYYMKLIDDINNGKYLEVNTDKDNDTTFALMKHEDTTILNPIPQNDEFLLSDDIKGLAYTKPIQLPLTATELDNIREATEIIYGIDEVANIGEMCLCSGVDTISEVSNVEAAGVQANLFVEVDIPISDEANEGIITILELGGMELMNSVGL